MPSKLEYFDIEKMDYVVVAEDIGLDAALAIAARRDGLYYYTSWDGRNPGSGRKIRVRNGEVSVLP